MAASDPNTTSSQVKSATRTLDIIEYIVAHDRPLVAQEIAVSLGIPKARFDEALLRRATDLLARTAALLETA